MKVFKTFETLRGKLIFSFSLFLTLLVAVVAINYWARDWRDNIYHTEQQLHDIQLSLANAKQIEALFFKDEIVNAEFYKDGKSVYIQEHALLMKQLAQDLKALQRSSFADIQAYQNEVDIILSLLDQYTLLFTDLVDYIIKRGFKDWGMEGQMRKAIHDLEAEKSLDLAKVLMIRRHEKDFIIRKDEKYVVKLQIAVSNLKEEITITIRNKANRNRLLHLLDDYQTSFEQLVQLEKLIGFDNQKGLRKSLHRLSQKLGIEISQLNVETLMRIHSIDQNTRYWSIGLTLFLLLFGIIMAFSMAKSLGRPINELSHAIRSAIDAKFNTTFEIKPITGNDEIARLSSDVVLMHDTIKENLLEISSKSKKIENKQRLLLDSLRYAEQIQEAILPAAEDLATFFKSHFVIYRPVHVVSGDFYWTTRRKNKVFIAVADCTGHGVPGAFMSMIGHSLLNKIVVQLKVLDPPVIMEVLHLEIQEALQQGKGNMNEDGMDMAICSIEVDEQTQVRTVQFSGAKQGIAYTNQGTFTYLSGTRRSLGGKKSAKSTKEFALHTIKLAANEQLYFFSDGFADQHNMEGKKLGKKRLLRCLEENTTRTVEEQKDELITQLQVHQGKQEQRDDITLIGLTL